MKSHPDLRLKSVKSPLWSTIQKSKLTLLNLKNSVIVGAVMECICALEGHESTVWNVSWSPNGQFLASCGGDKTICLWGQDGEEWKLKAKLVGEEEGIMFFLVCFFVVSFKTLMKERFDAFHGLLMAGFWQQQVLTVLPRSGKTEEESLNPLLLLKATRTR